MKKILPFFALLLMGCPHNPPAPVPVPVPVVVHDPFAVNAAGFNMVSDYAGNPVTHVAVLPLVANQGYCVFGTVVTNLNNNIVDLYFSKTDVNGYINFGVAQNAHVYLYKDPVQGPVIFEVLLEDMNTKAIQDTVYYGRPPTNPQLPDRLLGAPGEVSVTQEAQYIDVGLTNECPSNTTIITPNPTRVPRVWGLGPWQSGWDTVTVDGTTLLRGNYAEGGDFGGCYVERWTYNLVNGVPDSLQTIGDYRTTNCATARFTLTRVAN